MTFLPTGISCIFTRLIYGVLGLWETEDNIPFNFVSTIVAIKIILMKDFTNTKLSSSNR